MKVLSCAGREKILRGLSYSRLTMSSTVSLPSLTAVRSSGSMVSRPGYPGGGFSESFSSTAWGAVHTDTNAPQHVVFKLRL